MGGGLSGSPITLEFAEDQREQQFHDLKVYRPHVLCLAPPMSFAMGRLGGVVRGMGQRGNLAQSNLCYESQQSPGSHSLLNV